MAFKFGEVRRNEYTISEILQEKQLPVIVRDCAKLNEEKKHRVENVIFPEEDFVLDQIDRVEVALVLARKSTGQCSNTCFVPTLCPVKFWLQRPKKEQRFFTVRQIIESRPNFIRVDKSCWSDSFRESRSCLIEQGTGFKVEQVIQKKNEKERYLKLAGKSGHFYLKESTNIKMTEVPDTTTNTLQQLKISAECPFWVRLECATDNFIALTDPYHRRRTYQMLTDPVQVVQFSSMTFVVAWTVADDDMVKCAIVPPNVFSVQKLEIQSYPTNRFKRMTSIRDPMIIRTGLYMIPLSFSELIWIQKAQPTGRASKRFEYRAPLIKTGPDNSGLMQRSISLQVLNTTPLDKPRPRNFETIREVDSRARSRTFPSFGVLRNYLKSKFKTQSSEASPSHESGCSNHYLNYFSRDSTMKDSETRLSYNDLRFPRERATRKEQILDEMTEKHKERSKEVGNDFFDYSVQQVMSCFKQCSLDKLARVCQRRSLDGPFFRQLDLESLKLEPFYLDNLAILKVKKIMFEGWRPKV